MEELGRVLFVRPEPAIAVSTLCSCRRGRAADRVRTQRQRGRSALETKAAGQDEPCQSFLHCVALTPIFCQPVLGRTSARQLHQVKKGDERDWHAPLALSPSGLTPTLSFSSSSLARYSLVTAITSSISSRQMSRSNPVQ